ncbi:MAG TPA: hypothetical protein VEV84_11985 [Pyrinomonadaceae bacterium]|nr:hypothetical protein [Pyrinomonadaceae bacterium]
MGLLDAEENETAESAAFDEESKIRLFETQKRESKSAIDYLKKFLPVIVVAIVIIGGIIWLMQPGIGDAVKPPKEVEEAVDEYMLTKEHRSVREITFYKCDGFYWVKILTEPRSALSSVDDPENQFRLSVRSPDGKAADITTLPLPPKEKDKPCLVQQGQS